MHESSGGNQGALGRHGRAADAQPDAKMVAHSNGFKTFTPARLKSRVFRVAMVRS
jgi:hypothetical protein